MQRVREGFAFAVILIVIGGGLWLWWNFDLRWRPRTIARNQAEIAKILDGAGWVSPHLPGPKLYVIAYRDCPDCVAFERDALPRLQAAGVDTRIIMVARADTNGLTRSTAPERATVAELWLNRDWSLLQRWLAASPPGAWTAPGVAPADGDAARTAVVEAGRKALEDLTPLLKANGIAFAWPTAIWWTRAGVMRACACRQPQSYGPMERELGA
jgi:hypothetical protein